MLLLLLPLRAAWGLRRAGASCESAAELQLQQRSPFSAAAFPLPQKSSGLWGSDAAPSWRQRSMVGGDF